MKKKNLALVAAAVAVAGALVYLFSSEEGKKLRKKAKEKGKDMLSKVGTVVKDFKDKEAKEATS